MKPPLAVHEERQIAGLDAVLPAARRVCVGQLAVDRRQPVLRGPDGVHEPVAA